MNMAPLNNNDPSSSKCENNYDFVSSPWLYLPTESPPFDLSIPILGPLDYTMNPPSSLQQPYFQDSILPIPQTSQKEDKVQDKSRIEKNRQAARASRKRKQDHYANLEARCEELENQNRTLRAQLFANEDSLKKEEEDKMQICVDIEDMINRGASDVTLAATIHAFKEQYADYGRGRQHALDYHLHQVERLLLPTEVTKMCMWALQQDDGFWSELQQDDESSLLSILKKELGITTEQKQKINTQRTKIDELRTELRKSLLVLKELRETVRKKNELLDTEMEILQKILTPTQTAKFIVWVTRNPMCLRILDHLWKSALVS